MAFSYLKYYDTLTLTRSSLICAAVLFIMWKNVAEEHDLYKNCKGRNNKEHNTPTPPPPPLTLPHSPFSPVKSLFRVTACRNRNSVSLADLQILL